MCHHKSLVKGFHRLVHSYLVDVFQQTMGEIWEVYVCNYVV